LGDLEKTINLLVRDAIREMKQDLKIVMDSYVAGKTTLEDFNRELIAVLKKWLRE